MTELTASSPATTLTLRVAEARVEDIGHAIARLAPADMLRIGARAGDVLKIAGGTVAVVRAELSDEVTKASFRSTVRPAATAPRGCRSR